MWLKIVACRELWFLPYVLHLIQKNNQSNKEETTKAEQITSGYGENNLDK